MNVMLWAILVGIGATVIMDIWALVWKHVFGVPSLGYGLVGRWIAHMPRGRFAHEHIGKTEPVAGEGPIGWIVHYATGIVFAAALPMLGGNA